jgi:hypothetical protein
VITIDDRVTIHNREIATGIVLDDDAGGKLVGIDIDNATVSLRRPAAALDGDVAFQVRVGGAIDLAHAACAERPGDLVSAETRAGRLEPRFWPLG